MARKRKAALPRITLLAYSKRDLVRFSDQMEGMHDQINRLEVLLASMSRELDRLKAYTPATRRTRPRPEVNGETGK